MESEMDCLLQHLKFSRGKSVCFLLLRKARVLVKESLNHCLCPRVTEMTQAV